MIWINNTTVQDPSPTSGSPTPACSHKEYDLSKFTIFYFYLYIFPENDFTGNLPE